MKKKHEESITSNQPLLLSTLNKQQILYVGHVIRGEGLEGTIVLDMGESKR